MKAKTAGLEDLLRAISADMSAEDLLLAGLQGAIAAEIAIKRHEKGLSQKDFAALMGVSQGLVSRWEKGECNFTLETLIKIASKLDIQVQCPFVTKVPTRYSSSTDNIVELYPDRSSWESLCSSPCPGFSYEICDEM